ncbi:MAG: EpsI family protein [Candidatus Brocadia sp.]|nr:EpsI family protein [Candidatus Brocadia sp.]
MNNSNKAWIIIALLLSAIIYCFGFPKVKYVSVNMLSRLNIPFEINGWQGRDMDQEWNIEAEEYNFISQALDREYVNVDGKNIFLLILDAGNFHNPKVCSNSSGFTVRELHDSEFQMLNRTVKAHTLYIKKGDEGFLISYWICIDKNIVDWTGQKIRQLWFSLIGKKRAGLMIRLDVPANEDAIEDALRLSKEFVADLAQTIPQDQVGYIFGNPSGSITHKKSDL